MWQWYRRQQRSTQLWVGGLVLVALFVVGHGIFAGDSTGSSAAPRTATAKPVATHTPVSTHTPVATRAPKATATSEAPVYPPNSVSDAKSLAASSRVALNIVSREMLSEPPCRCRISVLVPQGVSGKRQAAALLRVFFANRLDAQLDNYGHDGGVVVFGFRKRSDIGAGSFTAGRVELQVVNGVHTFEVDTGSDLSIGGVKLHEFKY